MTTLESVVLPLAESRSLVEKGIVLDTVAWWQRSLVHIDHPVSAHIKGDNSAMGIEDFFEDICPAPTLSELLDAIRERHPDAEIISRCTWPGAALVIRFGENYYKNIYGDTVILAACALLLEVAK